MSSSPEPPPMTNPFDASPEKDHEPRDNSNGTVRGDSQEGVDVTKTGDVKQSDLHEDEGLVSASLRSPMQTRVRRISAELRLSASSNLDNLKKAGKGLSTGLHTMANKLPLPGMPKSLRRRSWHYEEVEQNSLLEPDSLTAEDAEGGSKLGKPKSKSSENLTKKANKEDNDEETTRGVSEKSFLLRKWEARKNKDQESKPDEKKDSPLGDEKESSNQGNEALSVESIPIVFEPLMLGHASSHHMLRRGPPETEPKQPLFGLRDGVPVGETA